MAKNKFQIDRERDYARELARQIAHADPYEESTRADNRFREETALEGYDERPGLPPAPQLPADLNAREQECEFGEYCDDDRTYAVDNQPCAAEKGYRRVAQRARRTQGSVMAIVGCHAGYCWRIRLPRDVRRLASADIPADYYGEHRAL
jgi:hypothetical protein